MRSERNEKDGEKWLKYNVTLTVGLTELEAANCLAPQHISILRSDN